MVTPQHVFFASGTKIVVKLPRKRKMCGKLPPTLVFLTTLLQLHICLLEYYWLLISRPFCSHKKKTFLLKITKIFLKHITMSLNGISRMCSQEHHLKFLRLGNLLENFPTLPLLYKTQSKLSTTFFAKCYKTVSSFQQSFVSTTPMHQWNSGVLSMFNIIKLLFNVINLSAAREMLLTLDLTMSA